MNGITEAEIVWYLIIMGAAGGLVAYVLGKIIWRRK